MARNRKEGKEFVIPTAPSSTTYESLLSDEFSVENGGGKKTNVSQGRGSVSRAQISQNPVSELVEDRIEDLIDTPEVSTQEAKSETDPAEESARQLKKKISSGASPDVSEFARFKEVYSSKDGQLAVFEDAEGHLVAVDASKLA